MVGAVLAEPAQAFEAPREIQVCPPALGRARALMRVAFGFFPLTLGDRDLAQGASHI